MHRFFGLTCPRSELLLVHAFCRSHWLHRLPCVWHLICMTCGTSTAMSSVQPVYHPRCASRCLDGSLVCRTSLKQHLHHQPVRSAKSQIMMLTNKIFIKKLQIIYLMLYKQQIKRAKIKSISTNVSVSLYNSLIRTPGIQFVRYFTTCSLFFCHILRIRHPFIMSSWRLNITYLGVAQKTCVYNFALGSTWTPNPSIMKHNAGMGVIA